MLSVNMLDNKLTPERREREEAEEKKESLLGLN